MPRFNAVVLLAAGHAVIPHESRTLTPKYRENKFWIVALTTGRDFALYLQ